MRTSQDEASSKGSGNEFGLDGPAAGCDGTDPSDKRNPKNWSMLKKIMHTIIPGLLAFEIVFSTSVTVPASPILMLEFSISRTVATLPLTLYALGLAFGPLFSAPLSEAVGRRPVYISSVALLLAFTAGAGGAQNLATLLVCRFLAGFFGSAGVAIGAGTLADVWDGSAAQGPASIMFILGPFLGPTLGPIASAYTLHGRGNDWRWTQWLVLMVGAPAMVGVLCMSETSAVALEHRGEKGAAGDGRWKGAARVVGRAVARPMRMLFTEIIVASLTLYTAFAYAMIFSYFSSSSYVLPRYYGFTVREVGLSFIGVIIGYILATVVFAVFDRTLYARAAVAEGSPPSPKHRLYSALVGSFFLPAGLFWYAWEAHNGGRWAPLVASGIPFGFGAFSLFVSTIAYLVDVYKAGAAASALAANGTLRYIFGAVFPLFTTQMYENLGVHWAGSVFAFLSLLLLPIPWLLFRYGDGLRNKNKSTSEVV